jgi:hypothetical protein
MANILIISSDLKSFASFAKAYLYLHEIGPDETWQTVVSHGVHGPVAAKLAAQDDRIGQLIKLLHDFLEARKSNKVVKEEEFDCGPTLMDRFA